MAETRRRFEEKIIAKYRDVVADTEGEEAGALRELDEGAEPDASAHDNSDEDSSLL